MEKCETDCFVFDSNRCVVSDLDFFLKLNWDEIRDSKGEILETIYNYTPTMEVNSTLR